MTPPRGWLVAGLMAAAGLVAAGCSSSPSNTAGSTTTTTSTAGSTSTTSGSTVPTTTSTTSSPAGCSGVSATAGTADGAAGTITGTIVIASSAATCTVNGYPKMVLFASNGLPINVTIVNGLSVSIGGAANAPPATVTLSPSSKLEFTYQFSDVPSGNESSCATSSTVSVALPGNSTQTQAFPLALDPCNSGTIRVSPLYVHS